MCVHVYVYLYLDLNQFIEIDLHFFTWKIRSLEKMITKILFSSNILWNMKYSGGGKVNLVIR